jgi:hypothetical protein
MTVVYNNGTIEITLKDKVLTLIPGMDLSDLPTKIQNIATEYWTQEVINAYNDSLAKDQQEFATEYNRTAPPTPDEIYTNALKNEPLAVALTLAINDGSLVPSASVALNVLKQTLKAKL